MQAQQQTGSFVRQRVVAEIFLAKVGKAEFILPNGTWVRIGGSTQIQIIALKPDVTEVDVASGFIVAKRL